MNLLILLSNQILNITVSEEGKLCNTIVYKKYFDVLFLNFIENHNFIGRHLIGQKKYKRMTMDPNKLLQPESGRCSKKLKQIFLCAILSLNKFSKN